jgi:L-lactate dehydrogenase
MNQARSTVAVVGAGRVGSAVANALVLLRVCDRVVIYDHDLALVEGEAWDIPGRGQRPFPPNDRHPGR